MAQVCRGERKKRKRKRKKKEKEKKDSCDSMRLIFAGRIDRAKAEAQFEKLVRALDGVGLRTEVRDGASGNALVFVRVRSEQKLVGAVYRSRYVPPQPPIPNCAGLTVMARGQSKGLASRRQSCCTRQGDPTQFGWRATDRSREAQDCLAAHYAARERGRRGHYTEARRVEARRECVSTT